MQKEAEKAQKVFQATGLAIEDVKFKNEALTQAMNDAGVSASQFAVMFQEECANVAKRAFGDISLSLKEVKKVASEITFAGMAEELDEFANVVANTEEGFNNLKSSVTNLKKENWKVGLGMELSETDKDSYRGAIENFLSTSQDFIDNNHYQATVALKLLTGEEADTTNLDSYYGSLKSQLEDLGTKLADSMNAALEDSIITPDEAIDIENRQNQISDITNKLADAKTDAAFQTLQIKHKGAALNVDSFNALQEELQALVASASEQYDNALTMRITDLNLQLKDKVITEEEYQKKVEEATKGYYANINEMDVRVRTFNLDSIATAFEEQLSDIMPDIEGTVSEKLSHALDDAMIKNPNIAEWESQDIVKWMGLDKLDLDTSEQTTIALELKQIALAVPEGTKKQLIDSYLSQIPTIEEIKNAIDWSALTNNDISEMMQQVGAVVPDNGIKQVEMPLEKWAERYGKDYEELINNYSRQIGTALFDNRNMENLSTFTSQYLPNFKGSNDINDIIAQYSSTSNEDCGELMKEWEDTGISFGTAFSTGASTALLDSSSLLRTDMQTALNTAIENPFTISPVINMLPAYNLAAPIFSMASASQETSNHAAGGYVSSGPQLSWLAEEGYGEFVIPTNPSRRARALDLYQQAGIALGISAHATGGFIRGSNLSDNEIGYNFNKANKNASTAYNENPEDNYSETTPIYEPVSVERENSSSVTPVQIQVSLQPQFVINGGDGQSEKDIMQVIRRHLKEMADELGGEIAANLSQVFSNMPLKKV